MDTEKISIPEWARNNGKTPGAGRHAAKALPLGTVDNGKLLSTTPWPFSPRGGGWTKGKARKVEGSVGLCAVIEAD